jgi:hypothetical protein
MFIRNLQNFCPLKIPSLVYEMSGNLHHSSIHNIHSNQNAFFIDRVLILRLILGLVMICMRTILCSFLSVNGLLAKNEIIYSADNLPPIDCIKYEQLGLTIGNYC